MSTTSSKRYALAAALIASGLFVWASFAQQPAESNQQKRAVSTGFKRMRPLEEQDLSKQLLQVRELDRSMIPAALAAAEHSTAAKDVQGEIRALESIRRAGAASQEANKSLPEQLPQYHKAVFEVLGLPGNTESSCELGQDAAKRLATWSTVLRSHQWVSTPGRDGEWTPPQVKSLLDIRAGNVTRGQDYQHSVPTFMQMLQGEEEASRLFLVEVLVNINAPAAGPALARLALFDVSPQVREQAVLALKSASNQQYWPILLDGFRYPWPPVAEHAAEALVALDYSGAVPKLKSLLDQPDPAAPVVKPGTGKPPQVAEMVRINHLRNCLLCHAVSTNAKDPVRGFVPRPGVALTPVYYGEERFNSSGPFIRADTTYLRQDFSVMQKVDKPDRWPQMQRFDFLIRTRDATREELARLDKKEKPATYPQREAVLWAIKELTRK